MSRPPKTLREALEQITYASDDGSEYEHNEGCEGQAECAACWVLTIRQILAAHADVLNLAEAILADPHRDDHILELREDGWTLKHPIAERIGDDLFRCPLAAEGDLLREEWENDAHEDLGLYKVELDGPEGDRWLRMELVRPA